MEEDYMLAKILDVIDECRPKDANQNIMQLKAEKAETEIKYKGLQNLFISLQEENKALRKQLKVACNSLMEKK
jgi:hypothetical protein